MQKLLKAVIGLAIVLGVHGGSALLSRYAESNDGLSFREVIQQMLVGIYEERSFETILLGYAQDLGDPVCDAFQELPKVLLTKGYHFEFIRKFNANIVTVITMSTAVDEDLLETTALTLNYMRQVRILVVAVNVLSANQSVFGMKILEMCRTYKMTNVILKFINTSGSVSWQYLKLKPYPQYHWAVWSVEQSKGFYCPPEWENMHNKTLVTYTTQTIPRAFFFKDPQGNLKLNGYVARLVMLFAEKYNATLSMYQPLEAIRYTLINKLVEQNQLDIPMVIDTAPDGKWLHRSDVVDSVNVKLMVPCARPKTKREIFSILLNLNFMGSLIICTLIFSIAHSLIDYLFDGLTQRCNFVISDKAWPGVLGQSFTARKSPRWTLKLIYILLFFTGFNTSIQFSANMNTLFTKPPHERPIESFDDFNKSPMRVLDDAPDVNIPANPILKPHIYTYNSTLFKEYRQNFNTSYAYFVSSTSWKLFTQKQQYFSEKVFCTNDNLTLYSAYPLAMLLQQHSEYKEPLDYLIHRVRELGLIEAWYLDTFSDMLKAKEISIRHSNPEQEFKDLTLNDLYWIWMIVLIGLPAGLLVFLMELWTAYKWRRVN